MQGCRATFFEGMVDMLSWLIVQLIGLYFAYLYIFLHRLIIGLVAFSVQYSIGLWLGINLKSFCSAIIVTADLTIYILHCNYWLLVVTRSAMIGLAAWHLL